MIIEMDAGLSHDPRAYRCSCVCSTKEMSALSVLASSMAVPLPNPVWRWFLSKMGTVLSNVLLGTSMYDMTSGYQGFHRAIVKRFCWTTSSFQQPISTRPRCAICCVPQGSRRSIHYKAPSPRVSGGAIGNSLAVLLHYFQRRLLFRSVRV